MATPFTSAPIITNEQFANGSVNLLGWMPTGTYNVPQPVQIPSTIVSYASSAGVVLVTEDTTSATPVVVSGLPTIAPTGGYCFLQGSVVAQDQLTRDMAVWNIALAVSRLNNATNCVAQGDTTPAVFIQQGTTVPCSITLGASSAGPIITLTGAASRNIAWTVSLLSSVGA